MIDPPRMFVYGTLMPGRLRWPVLAPYASGHREAAAAGAVYDSGRGWPLAVFGGGAGRVPGHVVDLVPATVDECLAVIDEVEETDAGELRRVAVVTDAGERAWAYHYTRSTAGLTVIDGWHAVDVSLER